MAISETTVLQVKHHQTGHKFWDDCGAWNGSNGHMVYAEGQSFTQLCILPGGLYGQSLGPFHCARLIFVLCITVCVCMIA